MFVVVLTPRCNCRRIFHMQNYAHVLFIKWHHILLVYMGRTLHPFNTLNFQGTFTVFTSSHPSSQPQQDQPFHAQILPSYQQWQSNKQHKTTYARFRYHLMRSRHFRIQRWLRLAFRPHAGQLCLGRILGLLVIARGENGWRMAGEVGV